MFRPFRAHAASLVVAALATALVVAIPAHPLHAQGRSSAGSAAGASAYVPLDDNAYVYADALITRGRLRALSLIERPYRVNDFKRAMAADTAGSPAIQALYQRLAEAIAKYDVSDLAPGTDALRVAVTPYVTGVAQSSGTRDLMRADSTNSTRPGFGGIGIGQAGPLVIAGRAYDDPRLKDDPEFLGQKDRVFVGRMEDAYTSLQFKYGEIFLGRLGRNWGPPQFDGLLLGHYAYTYDHLYAKLGVPNFHLSTVVTRLDDAMHTTAGVTDTARRYLSIHQLDARFGAFEAAVSEAVIYGGKTENFRANFVNPLAPYILSQVLEHAPGNDLIALDLAYRSPFGNFGAQGMIDDLIKDHCDPNCTKPNSFGLTVTAEGVPLVADQRLFAAYTMVSNLAYRNEEWYNAYMSDSVGIGRGYSDYDEARVGLDLIALPGVPLRPYLAYRRQGEGDYRLPHPPVSEYTNTKQFLQGVVERTTRIGISGVGSIARFIHVTGDLGYNHVTNAQHVPDATHSSFEGRVGVTIDSPWRLAGAFNPD